jgi:hypothetical protein
MYPIRIFGIRVPPDGHYAYAQYDDVAVANGKNPIVSRPTTLKKVAIRIACTMFREKWDDALLCVREEKHAHNLFAFSAKPEVRGIETRGLDPEEQEKFLIYFHTTLVRVKKRIRKLH